MKKVRNVSISISLPLERLVYLSKRCNETDMSTSQYMEMLLLDDEHRQKELEEVQPEDIELPEDRLLRAMGVDKVNPKDFEF